jgi:hypothetical protein
MSRRCISISRRRNSEILVHCECSDTDIDTVKERYKVEQDHEWYEAPSHLSEYVIRDPDLFHCRQSYSRIGHLRSFVLSHRFAFDVYWVMSPAAALNRAGLRRSIAKLQS